MSLTQEGDHRHQHPWSHIALDFISGYPPSKCTTVILTIAYQFCKATQVVDLPDLHSAPEISKLWSKHAFCLRSIPSNIVSDHGPPSFFGLEEFCQAMGAKGLLSSGLHPQTNGESGPGSGFSLCVYATYPRTWNSDLPWVEYKHNFLILSATGLSLKHPWVLSPPFVSGWGEGPGYTLLAVQAQIRWCRRIWRETFTAFLRMAQLVKWVADCCRTVAGQNVWLATKDIPSCTESYILSTHFIGPLEVDSFTLVLSVSSFLAPYAFILFSTSFS